MLDPGHGGKDFGKLSPTSLREKDVTLDISLRVKDLLSNWKAYPILTRIDDSFVSSNKRKQILSNKDFELFITIHTGASSIGNVIGPRAKYSRGVEKGKLAADTVYENLYQKLPFPHGGVHPSSIAMLL